MTGSYKHLRFIFLALLLAGCEMPVALDEPIDVRVVGRVTDAETGAPLDSTSVTIESGFIFVDREVHAATRTSADGRYELIARFESECPGDLRVAATAGVEYGFDRDLERLACEDGTFSVDLVLMREEEATDGETPGAE